jgi:hypothetical protein
MRPTTALMLAGLVLLALAGCSDEPTRLYVLTATTEKPAATSPSGVAIGIGPITLPKYLDARRSSPASRPIAWTRPISINGAGI